MSDMNENIVDEKTESSRIYSLFYSFFLIPLMIVVFGILFYLLFAVITEEPTDINQLLVKLETGSIRDKANASYRMNKLFYNDPSIYNASYRDRIIKIHNMSKSELLNDNTLRMHTIMIMGNSTDTTFGSVLMDELYSENEEFRIKAIEALGKLKFSGSSSSIKQFLSSENSFLEKLAAAGSLGNIANKNVIPELVSLINRWPSDWLDTDGPELRWEAALALLKMDYSDDNTNKIINNLLLRSYYSSYQELDENTVNFVILKILNILYSIDDTNLLLPFSENLKILSDNDSNLEIRNFAKKSLKLIQ
tara:strand:+ start:21262 stop:22182 length:921 start_codon:yes stop_codon:yes gene_type:complete